MSCANEGEQRAVPAGAENVLIASIAMLAGAALMLLIESIYYHATGRTSLPQSVLDRRHIVFHLAAWILVCLAATALTVRFWRRSSGRSRIVGHQLMAASCVAWLFLLAVTFRATKNSDVVRVAVVASVFLAATVWCPRWLERLARSAACAPTAIAIWLTLNRWLFSGLATAPFGTLVVIAGIAGLWCERAGRSIQVNQLNSVALAAVVVLEFAKSAPLPATIMLCVLASVAGMIGRTPARLDALTKTGMTVVASALLGLVANETPSTRRIDEYLAAIVICLFLASMFRTHKPSLPFRGQHYWPTLANCTRWISSSNVHSRERLLIAGAALLVVLCITLLPMWSTVACGATLAITSRVFGRDESSHAELAACRACDRRSAMIWSFALIAVAIRIVFWVTTHRVWEDTLITIQHAENATRGFGLTHHPDHGRVHGFTSPLSVLIPLLGEWMYPGGAIPALRIVGMVAAALTIPLAGKIAAHPAVGLSYPALFLWLAYLALDHSQIAFGMSGMETQVWTCVLLAGAATVLFSRPAFLGLALAGAALCRPDAMVWIGICWASSLLWGARRAAIVIGVTLAGFAPWLTFTWLYYGSPVPNTVLAKAAGYVWMRDAPVVGHSFIEFALHEWLVGMHGLLPMLSPHFVGHGLAPVATTPAPGLLQHGIAFLGALGMVRMMRRSTWPIVVYIAAFAFFMLVVVRIWFVWYPIAPLGLAAVMVANGFDGLFRADAGLARSVKWLLAVGLAVCYVAPLPRTFRTEARIQSIVEDGIRKPIGVWLHHHAHPSDTVTCECLGYLGYYSRLPIHDFPGLASPQVVRLLRTNEGAEPPSLGLLARKLNPTWLVLRPEEIFVDPNVYEEVKVFAMSAEERAALSAFLPVTTKDDEFHIFRRRIQLRPPK